MINPALTGSLRSYKDVKQVILASIWSGEWPPDRRVPSENEIVAIYGVSKTTAERALRELASEGKLVRVPGIGSFVAKATPFPVAFNICDIADDIRMRGKAHTARVIAMSEDPAPFGIADELGIGVGSIVFRSVIVHSEDDVPLQIEDRFVLPTAVPDYLMQNFVEQTPCAYLLLKMRNLGFEYSIRAALPETWECKLLTVLSTEPCLSVHQRTTSSGVAISSARLLSPAGRYRLEAMSGRSYHVVER